MTHKRSWLKVLTGPVVGVLSLARLGVSLGPSPAEAQPFAYVSGGVSGLPRTVVIDTATDAVVDMVAAGGGGIAITPDGTRAYVETGNNTVVVIDIPSNTVVDTVAVPAGIRGDGDIAITPDGTRAYVAGPDLVTATVSVIDTDPNSSTYNTVVATVTVVDTPNGAPFGLAVTPDGTFAYVTNMRESQGTSVSVIDTASNIVVARITLTPFDTAARGIAISPDGTRAYVVDAGHSVLWVVDTATNTPITTIAVGGDSVSRLLTK